MLKCVVAHAISCKPWELPAPALGPDELIVLWCDGSRGDHGIAGAATSEDEPGLAWNNTTQKRSLSGLESRASLRLTDPNSNLYELQINQFGQLERHDPTAIPTLCLNYDTSTAGKQDSFSAARPLNFTASQTGFSVLESL